MYDHKHTYKCAYVAACIYASLSKIAMKKQKICIRTLTGIRIHISALMLTCVLTQIHTHILIPVLTLIRTCAHMITPVLIHILVRTLIRIHILARMRIAKRFTIPLLMRVRMRICMCIFFIKKLVYLLT